ncbi:hypothetical protein PLEOSDRAFT_1107712 [Pleurotus ostreatus PC15]|uniref:Uncharacterized protein n=1 Tax=Pleurotus ostreatus (strain PC15) TaxID=1137138 RepID=A0A067NMG4_PLEO1|nr:hypothetical protein PLEOSDRAFT_1107712 [Pleurotus ostreatus PC15]
MLARIPSLVALTILLLSYATSTISVAVVRRHHAEDGVYAFTPAELVHPRTDDESHLVVLEGRRNALARVAVNGIRAIIRKVQRTLDEDKDARGKFTYNLVSEMQQQYPGFNWVVCHTKHETKFDGEKGKEWDHRHQEFDIKLGGTVGFEIYNLKSGEFIRQGDGGFLNWAYIGNVASKSGDGKVIKFLSP